MRDLYKLLGVSADATLKDIKKAYRKQAIKFHPDKMQGGSEVMQQLNEAYATLSNPESRQDFDRERDIFQDFDDDDGEACAENMPLISSSVESFSASFKRQHSDFVIQFTHNPLTKGEVSHYFPGMADQSSYGGADDLFAYRRHQLPEDLHTNNFEPPEENLTLEIACGLLQNILSGDYYGRDLERLINYFYDALTDSGDASTSTFYAAIYDILLMLRDDDFNAERLLYAFGQITSHAKTYTTLPEHLVCLFQDRGFRHLFHKALDQHWTDDSWYLSPQVLDLYNQRENTESLFNTLREQVRQISDRDQRQSTLQLAKYIRLLNQFEREVNNKKELAYEAENYRELGYFILDWLPVFSGRLNGEVINNTLFQAAICFQLASQCENEPPWQMADEKLSQHLYYLAYSLSHSMTPDTELNCCLAALTNMSRMQFLDPTAENIIKSFHLRAQQLSDFFPFYEGIRSNTNRINDNKSLLKVMRSYLHHLVEWAVINETEIIGIDMDHSNAMVIYQAYEACIKGWYENSPCSETQEQMRRLLISILLADHGWDVSDVDDNMDFSTTVMTRTDDKWLQAPPMLSVTPQNNELHLQSVDGVTIDPQYGQIQFFGTPCTPDTPDCFKLLSQQDVAEMFQRNIPAAIFSLDPIDPAMPYHPFNTMRFVPYNLHGSRFLKTLLSTDYLLKMLTVGQEVQGSYPYSTRSLEHLTSHLPEYLKQTITEFQQSQRSESLHRFWIEATLAPVAFKEAEDGNGDKQNIFLDDVQMVVRKHQMRRDERGNLIDAEPEHEGWHFYIITTQQKQDFDNNRPLPDIQHPAILLTYGNRTIRFFESETRSIFTIRDYNDQLSDIFQCAECEENGKIKETPKVTNMLYRLGKEIARQSGKPHRYSPEHVFAQEMTRFYDEFALFFPELGRLKAMCRLMVLVRIMDSVRESNDQIIDKMRSLMDDISLWQRDFERQISQADSDHPLRQMYQEISDQVRQSVAEHFNTLRQQLNYPQLLRTRDNQLREIRQTIGEMNLRPFSQEVNEACQSFVNDIMRQMPAAPQTEVWNEINGRRSQYAEQLSKAKRDRCRQDLQSTFTPLLNNRLSAFRINHCIDRFLQNDISPLAQELAAHDYDKALTEINQAFASASRDDIRRVLGGDDDTLHQLIESLVNKNFKQNLASQREQLQSRLTGRRALARRLNAMGLNQDRPEIDLTGQCLWVPANLKQNTSSNSDNSHTLFCYGGVSANPKIETVNQVNTSAGSGPINTGDSGGANAGAGGGAAGGGGANSGGRSGPKKPYSNAATNGLSVAPYCPTKTSYERSQIAPVVRH